MPRLTKEEKSAAKKATYFSQVGFGVLGHDSPELAVARLRGVRIKYVLDDDIEEESVYRAVAESLDQDEVLNQSLRDVRDWLGINSSHEYSALLEQEREKIFQRATY